jgi:copper chaperone
MSDAQQTSATDVTLRVGDMTCGHCVQAITKAVQKAAPGARVHADPVSKLVAVSGAGDIATVKALITKAGFTPTAV